MGHRLNMKKSHCKIPLWNIMIIQSQWRQSHSLLPARSYAGAGLCNVTRRYCVKTKKASVMISSVSCSPTILVFWSQISLQNSKGFCPSGSPKEGWGGKIQRFSSFKHQYLENVADTAKVTINDYNRKSYMGFRLTPRSMTLGDLELL